jgi:hypothetical protein
MYTGYRRFRTLCRGFRSAPAPLHRRLWGLVLALLPLALRRPLLRLAALWSSTPPWLIRGFSDLGGYLAISAGALLVLWLWSRAGAQLCSGTLEAKCEHAHTAVSTDFNAW